MSQQNPRVLGHEHDPLRISWDRRIDTVVVRVAGEIDLSTIEMLDAGLRSAGAVAEPCARMIVDLRRVEFLGVAGLHVLCRAQRRCASSGVTFIVVADQAAVTRPMRSLDLLALLGVAPQYPSGFRD